MSDIYEPPLDYDFGLDFDYSVWTEDSEIEFLNVPWDAQYRDTVRFVSRDELNKYVDNHVGLKLSLMDLSYIKPNTPIYVDIPHNSVNRYNYIRVRNPIQPVGGDIQKDFYYFITGVEYINPNNTAIYVQLDVWQTFIYDVQFGTCYVERGHIGIANTKNFDSFGRDYLTVPEGIDVGSEMRVIAKRKNRIMGFGFAFDPQGQWYETADFCVVVVATQDLTAPARKEDGSAQVVTARGSKMEGVASGAGLYAFQTAQGFVNWMANNSNEAWRTQSIQAAYIVPNLQRYMPAWQWNEQSDHAYDLSAYKSYPKKSKMFTDWRNSPDILGAIPERYRHLRKLFTFPYMAIQMTTWTATPIILKPESWAVADADIIERASLMPPSQRLDIMPRKYNADPNANIDNWLDLPDHLVNELLTDVGDDGGEYLDFATRIQNFPSIPIVSNTGVAYLAANQASIQQSYAAADWSQQRALSGAETAYRQANQTGRTMSTQANIDYAMMGSALDINNQSIINNTNIDTATGMAHGLLGSTDGGKSFNPLGLLGAGINALGNNTRSLASIQTNRDMTAAQQSTLHRTEQNRQDQNSFMRDTNKEYADFAAHGDYAQTIAALDAKVRDAAMMQPSMSGQFGGESANLVNNTVEVSIRWKLIDRSALATIGEFWLQFGYAVHRTVPNLPADLAVMTKFTYWKIQKSYIRGANMPETMRQVIRGIMESGTTVWRNPNDIGFTDFADNTPIGGITL